MSISIGKESEFNHQRLHAAVIDDKEEGLVHTLAYSFETRLGVSRHYRRVPLNGERESSSTGRAFIFALPAQADSIKFIDASGFPCFLDDQVKALDHMLHGEADTEPQTFALRPEGGVVDIGNFTFLTAGNAKEIADVLSSNLVAENKRPHVSPEFISEMEALYGGSHKWPFVIGCFDAAAKERVTLFLRYRSLTPDYVYFPGLTGSEVPVVGAPVDTDHFLTVSAPDMVRGNYVSYHEAESVELRPFVPQVVRGLACFGRQPNGDFAIRRSDLTSLAPVELLRVAPPGSSTGLRAVATREDRWGF